jgi:hypothetical protein
VRFSQIAVQQNAALSGWDSRKRTCESQLTQGLSTPCWMRVLEALREITRPNSSAKNRCGRPDHEGDLQKKGRPTGAG